MNKLFVFINLIVFFFFISAKAQSSDSNLYNKAIDIVFKVVVSESIKKIEKNNDKNIKLREKIEKTLKDEDIHGTYNLLSANKISKTHDLAKDVDSILRARFSQYQDESLTVIDLVKILFSNDNEFKTLSPFLQENKQLESVISDSLSKALGDTIISTKPLVTEHGSAIDSLNRVLSEKESQLDGRFNLLLILCIFLFIFMIVLSYIVWSNSKKSSSSNTFTHRFSTDIGEIKSAIEVLRNENSYNRSYLSKLENEQRGIVDAVRRNYSQNNNSGVKQQEKKTESSYAQNLSRNVNRREEKLDNVIYLTQPNDDGNFYHLGQEALNYKKGIHVYEGRKTGANLIDFQILDNDDALHFAIDNPNRILLSCSEVENEIRPASIRGIKTLSPGKAELHNDVWVLKRKARVKLIY
jgi:hypothetical protein